ncbi:hypothetical protein M1M25_gp084 [Tenacibaculum phage Gundel_1]|uniref:Uncharacterized protein n=1 Tax=Tenacibaculum phage Gundel_1 TaxID=2745672 RepID=A0A8E4ZE15_9CAUD|nr:hypothetical protein M1M25_gp084 [Tenacibaculum phage Gundel_1]QQV91521.1 hypothetical protein Gundel1_84 [Tenacibaculum phage Gundel_1]
MKLESKIICVFLLIWSVLVYQFWGLLLEKYSIKIFYPGIALMMLGFVFVIWSESKNKSFKYFMELFLLLSFSNLIDEIFFDPTKLEINELIIALFLVFRFTFIIWKTKKEKH